MTSKPAVTTYIGLGSNLANPISQVTLATKELSQLPQTALIQVSSLYCSTPFDATTQPLFINAVAELKTTLEPATLLNYLLKIELHHKRSRALRWGPRTLDLDILLYGDSIISNSTLCIPHPGLQQRVFVIMPLLEINPHLTLPCGTMLASLVSKDMLIVKF